MIKLLFKLMNLYRYDTCRDMWETQIEEKRAKFNFICLLFKHKYTRAKAAEDYLEGDRKHDRDLIEYNCKRCGHSYNDWVYHNAMFF